MNKNVIFSGMHLVLALGLFASTACSEPAASPASESSVGKGETENTQSVSADTKSFSLTDVSGNAVEFSIPQQGVVVLEWFNQACPFVQKFYKSGYMQSLQKTFREKGVTWYVVNSTNASHRDFLSPKQRMELVSEWSINKDHFLFDERGVLGSHMKAKTTPHIFIFKEGHLVYAGAVDDAPDTDSNPENAKNHVKEVLTKSLENAEVELVKNRPYGCSIKYAN